MSEYSSKNPLEYEVEFIDPEELEEFSESGTENIEEIPAKITEEISKDYVIKSQESTRGNLAIIFTVGTFIIFIFAFIVSIIEALISKGSIIANLNSILPLISSIFLGLLGFIIGYYFRKGEEN